MHDERANRLEGSRIFSSPAWGFNLADPVSALVSSKSSNARHMPAAVRTPIDDCIPYLHFVARNDLQVLTVGQVIASSD